MLLSINIEKIFVIPVETHQIIILFVFLKTISKLQNITLPRVLMLANLYTLFVYNMADIVSFVEDFSQDEIIVIIQFQIHSNLLWEL